MINSTLNELLSNQSCQHWLALFEAERIPCAPVNNLGQALSDQQVLHRNMVIDLKHPNGKSSKGPGNPVKLSRTQHELFTAAPLLGEHTNEVMAELLNFSAEEIAHLRANEVIG